MESRVARSGVSRVSEARTKIFLNGENPRERAESVRVWAREARRYFSLMTFLRRDMLPLQKVRCIFKVLLYIKGEEEWEINVGLV